MYTEFYALQDREIREQELAELMAESRRQTLTASRGPSLRARMARRLFALAVAADTKRPGAWFGRGWKQREAYETKLAARGGRARRDALYLP